MRSVDDHGDDRELIERFHLHRRARAAVPPDVAATLPDVTDPASRLEPGERQALVRRAVDALPPHYRIVTALSGAEELSYQEIADPLRIPRRDGEIVDQFREAVAAGKAAPPARPDHLTRRLFEQILGRIERLVWHPA